MNDEQRQEIIRRLQQAEELSPEWARILFPPEKREYELVYHGKEREEDIIANTLAVPLQKVRTFGKNGDGWHNKLIFGDNLQVMKSLLELKRAGGLCNSDGSQGVRLVYIDPPFATKRDFSGKQEERAYQDRIAGARFVEFLRRRLVFIRELLADDGSIYLHLDQKKVHYAKIVLDEVFGEHNFVNEIIWKRTSAHSSARRFGPVHDTILFYAKSDAQIWNEITQPYDSAYVEQRFARSDKDGRPWKDADLTGSGTRRGETGMAWRGFKPTEKGRHWAYPPKDLDELDKKRLIYWPTKAGGWPRLKQYQHTMGGIPAQDVITDIFPINAMARERLDYPTQKPEELLARIIKASSREGDIVLDDRVLVLCPSNTIEDGLLRKFKELAGNSDLRDALPDSAKFRTPKIINASESIVEGSICVENYHAILENTKSSIRESLKSKGARVAVLNDEAHHVANESGTTSKRWKEFLEDADYGFRMVVGVSGTCYVADEYFADVVHRYSLRQAIEEKFVKTVEYVDELPPAAEKPEEKWQLVYNRHIAWKKKLKARGIRPLTIVVTKGIADAERAAGELQDFLKEWENLKSDQAAAKVLCVTSAAKHQPNVAKLRVVDSPASKVEWIVSVSMLSEGWDVKNVFQIVPHEERAFNSKLLIAQVLGRGLRRPDGWKGEEPVVTVFNHDSWSNRIKHLVNEILEIERRLTSMVDPASPHNFELYNLDYTREEDVTTYAKKGEYKLFEDGYVDLPWQVEAEDVTIGFERAVSGEHVKFKTTIQHKTWTVEEVAEQMYHRLKSIDDESKDVDDPKDRTSYAKKFSRAKCEEIVAASLKHAKIKTGKITDDNRQKFLQSLGTLRRKAAKRVIYKLSPKALVPVNTSTRQVESCSAAELRRGSKTIFYVPGCESTLVDEQKEFFHEVEDPDGDFRGGREEIGKAADFKTASNIVIADATPERKFVRLLVTRENAQKFDAWLKNTPVGFYWIEYAWKKGNTPKRGEFSPDFFIKQGGQIFVLEVKGDEEISDPSADNIKKHEYATDHFKRLNQWLEKAEIPTRYQFNMISPMSYNVFFQKLRGGGIDGFRSDLDVAMTKAAKTGS